MNPIKWSLTVETQRYHTVVLPVQCIGIKKHLRRWDHLSTQIAYIIISDEYVVLSNHTLVFWMLLFIEQINN